MFACLQMFIFTMLNNTAVCTGTRGKAPYNTYTTSNHFKFEHANKTEYSL